MHHRSPRSRFPIIKKIPHETLRKKQMQVLMGRMIKRLYVFGPSQISYCPVPNHKATRVINCPRRVGRSYTKVRGSWGGVTLAVGDRTGSAIFSTW